ncbi:MAG TPA: AAA family ATPase [Gemmatimonadota bacterium]|nr:AAA family ATPase [Gemmatimonadota bacterium]
MPSEEPVYATRATLAEENARVGEENAFVDELLGEVRRVMVGQQALLEGLLIGLLSDGHVLLEGVPGLAKTLAVRTLAAAIDCDFQRIQFTPDLLPADLVGTMIYHPQRGEFAVHQGPVFTNLLLADEINRAPAKVQSALLEAMQEKQVTLGETTHRLAEPFLVLATQNPIEHEGTYPLPEAQVDRFMLKLQVSYPARAEEREIIARMSGAELPQVRPVVGRERILRARSVVAGVYVDPKVVEYILDLVEATRDPRAFDLADLVPLIAYGASPRAGIYLTRAAKAHAFLRGRAFATPDDVKSVARDVLRHRLLLTYEAEAESVDPDAVLTRLLERIDVP